MVMYQYADKELAKAYRARNAGNEGKARVCARRASGLALQVFLTLKGIPLPTSNLMDLLSNQGIRFFLPQSIEPTLEHLTQRIGPDLQFPAEMDLLNEAKNMIELFKNTSAE